MVLRISPPLSAVRRRPRVRGDGPRCAGVRNGVAVSAPRTRGWSELGARLPQAAAVGPAYAGMVRLHTDAGCSRHRRPRVRGDGPPQPPPHHRVCSSAPRTRGWSQFSDDRPLHSHVGPAYAGMVPGCADYCAGNGCRPRVRGDGPRVLPRPHPASLSAPRTRGWSTRRARVGPHGSRSAPRTRGWSTRRARVGPHGSRSAPRTRGWSVRGLR